MLRPVASQGLQAGASGRQWLAPHPCSGSSSSCSNSSLRTQHSRTEASLQDAAILVELIQWPEGTKPKRGGVTKAALSRLKLADLRAELSRLGAADTSGTKEQLAGQLLEAITAQAAGAQPPPAAPQPAAAAAAAQQASNGGRAAAQPQSTAAHEAASPAAPRVKAVRSRSRQQPAAHSPPAEQLQDTAAQPAAFPPNNSSSSDVGAGLDLAARLLLQKHGEAVQLGRMPRLDPREAARIAAAVGVDLESLPPLTQRSRGHVYAVDTLPGMDEDDREMVLKAIRSGLALTLLGGSAGDAAAGDCAPNCLGLVRERDIWLFDVGEDVQRALLRREHLRPSKMHRVVISRQAPDAMLGLPGVLCVIGSSREKGHESADIPVHVFAPAGTADFLSTLYECSNTFLEMPVVVHEFVTHAVPEEQLQPQPLNSRAKLWRANMPPDQLNPMGFIDGDIQAFMPTQGRARFKKGLRAAGGVLATNPRAGYRPMATPPPGDPTRTDLNPADMTWTVVADEAAVMTAVMLDADVPSWGIAWREADRQGNLSVPRCQALHISNEALYKDLKNGEAVENDQGVLIPAPMVCSEDKPGRTLVLLPACNSADNLEPHAVNADVMVAAAGAAAAVGRGRTGTGLGICAQQWGVRNLLVTALPISSSGTGSSVTQCRQRSSSSSSSTGEGGPEQQDQQQQQQLDPAAAAALSVISEQYTRGTVIPARDDMSLILEENLGDLDPPPVDLAEIAALARATCLQGEKKAETTNEKSLQRRARRLEQKEGASQQEQEPQPLQQQQRSPQRWQQQQQHGGWQQQRQQQQRDWQQQQEGQAGQRGRPGARPARRAQTRVVG